MDERERSAGVRTAFVTGAASGLGLEICRELLRHGYRVAMYSRDPEQLRLAALALAAGERVLAVPGDVTDLPRMHAAIESVEAQWGVIDVAIANAGIRAATFADTFSIDAARQLIETNYFGMLHLFDAVQARMRARRSGCFVAIASLAGLRALPGGAGYGASKAAIQAFLDTMRLELEPHGVRVVTVNPWFIRTAGKDDGVPRPMMVEPDWAAARIVAAIESGARQLDFPRSAAVAWRIVRALPNASFLWLFKPRRGRTSIGLKAMLLLGRLFGSARRAGR